MLIDFLAFMAKLVLALIILKMLEIHTVRRDVNSPWGQALAFLVG
jgi:hypothetical protein